MIVSRKSRVIHASPSREKWGVQQGRPLYEPTVSTRFLNSGRDALVWGLNFLGDSGRLKNRTIVLPALYCGSTAEHLNKYGFDIVWCEVDLDGCFSGSHLLKILKTRDVSVVIFCEFFGISSVKNGKLKRICNQYNVLIAFDRCHSVFSEIRDTSGVTFSVFSLRKVIEIDRAGILVFHDLDFLREEIKEPLEGKLPLLHRPNFSLKLLSSAKSILKQILISQKSINIYILFDFMRPKRASGNSSKVEVKSIECSLFPLSGRLADLIVDRDYLSKVVRRRRENFRLLEQMHSTKFFSNFRKLFYTRDAPQTLPLLVKNAADFSSYLRKNGVGVYAWPAQDFPKEVQKSPEEFPNANYLHQSIVCLPVHQMISSEDIKQIDLLVKNWQG
ncbi:DegT/DnrJ/EryC1/StrS family aminotransferase [Alphaproteobacteria bacterium]|nr:DegT/DnrJ/EryC1/StrS family aminotransferase [Alphaproteobacteria bacterium]